MELVKELDTLFDKSIVGINKLPYHADFDFYRNIDELKKKTSSLKRCLNGKWFVDYYENVSVSDIKEGKEIKATKSGKVNVPCNLELNGFGKPQYVNSQYPWDGVCDVKMGDMDFCVNTFAELTREFICVEKAEIGNFSLSKYGYAQDEDYRYIISFEGIEGAAFIYLNDEFVGYSENTFSPCEFDVTDVIKGHNKLMVRLYRKSSASYLEDQDFWRMSGIFRDVYLIKRKAGYLSDIKISYKLNSDYTMASFKADLDFSKNAVDDGCGDSNSSSDDNFTRKFDYAIISDKGEKIFSPSGENGGVIEKVIDKPNLWSAEEPNLYTLLITTKNEEDKTEEVVSLMFGFREFKLENKIMKLNGKRIVFNGVDRHEFSGFTGRAISKSLIEEDIKTMKQLNINAVRTSHYPNNSYFYRLCNKIGLYVIDEANLETHGSWQVASGYNDSSRIPGDDNSWKDAVFDRAESLYERDKNHPSVLMWSCGNESHGGKVIYEMSKFFKEKDDSRLVHYEGIFHDRTYNDTSDVESRMYAKPAEIEEYLNNNPEKPFINCEYMHAMGNSLGGMKLYTDLLKYDMYQGGFIWDYIDQNLYGSDGKVNYGGDFLDRPNDGNFCGDGIVFADRKLSPKACEVKKLYQSIKLTPDEEGVLIENNNLFIDTENLRFILTILEDGFIIFTDEIEANVKALSKEYIPFEDLNDVEINKDSAEITIRVSAILKDKTLWADAGYEIAFGETIVGKYQGGLTVEQDDETSDTGFKIVDGDYNLGVYGHGYSYMFSKVYCGMTSLVKDGREFIDGICMPVYTRAFTDNDRGYGLQFYSALYKIATEYQRPCDIKIDKNAEDVSITYSYQLWADKDVIVKTTYKVSSNGVLTVNMNYPGFNGAPLMPEFGLSIPVIKDYVSFLYYGLGPCENYIDRNEGVKLGIYENKVSNMLTEYARPQECGNRTSVRRVDILDMGEKVLSIEMIGKPFEFSFLPNSTSELDSANHMDELPESRHNTLKILAKQMGVGGDDSWGAPVHKEYQISGEESMEFSFRIF